jgi:hypothetical protein
MIAPSASAGKVKKKLRRGTGLPLPFFRFPRGRVDEDVEVCCSPFRRYRTSFNRFQKIEDDVNQLLHLGETIKIEVEVSAH